MTPGLFDPLRPYLALIRVALYATVLCFLFVSGCNYGKGRSQAKVDKLSAELQVCYQANESQLRTIGNLSSANEAYARQSEEQADKVAKAQKALESAQKRAEAEITAMEKELANARKQNPDWAATRVPDSYRRMLNGSGKD